MSGIDYTPRIYIRDFTVSDYRAFVTTLEYDLDGVAVTLLRDLFLRIDDETTGLLLLSGDEQTNGDGVDLSGDYAGYELFISDRASFRTTFYDAILTFGFRIEVGAGVYVLTGQAAQLLRDLFLRTDAADFELSGVAAALRRDLFLRTDATSFELVGFNTELDAGIILTAGASSYVLTGNDAALVRDLFLRTVAATYALDVTAVDLRRDLFLRATTTGAFALDGTSTDLSVVTTGEEELRLSGDQQAGGDGLLYTGDEQSNGDVVLLSRAQLEAVAGAFTIVGADAELDAALLLVVGGATYAVAGVDAVLSRTFILSVDSVEFVLTGIDVVSEMPIALSGDEQSGEDELELSGDEQSGTDVILTSF